ncbi:lysophospholipid acyltransferase family protein [Inquilinus limosus]|uniref:Acyltransferase n=1 Tax=Inquilinus limosus MP06 TaxID=1398085 RepID=A0A0A0CVG0_9PROT|nr:lysophospholipid acyltransferase family protein [Inquilinus limosus]KGM30391.1 acyltransferase [Inquilinus limosus MP06]
MVILRSALYTLLFYGWTTVCCFALLPSMLLSHRTMMAWIFVWLRVTHWLEKTILGIDYRVVGRENLPDGACIVAAKHQSAWETLKLHLLLPDPAIVLKSELLKVPVWGKYLLKTGMIPVDRGAGSRAIRSMIEHARVRVAEGRPIAIFPQGTRTAPGTWRPYRIGVGALYEGLNVPVVPMALNSGVFWGRRAFRKRPGTITVEFLPPIPPGLPREEMMRRLEEELETASERLSVAAGGPPTPRPAKITATV